MSNIPTTHDGKRLVGKGEVDPAEADRQGPPTKHVPVGKHKSVEVPHRTGEGGGGTGGGSPGELTPSPTSREESGLRSKLDRIDRKS